MLANKFWINEDSPLKIIPVFSEHIYMKANRIASNCTRLNLVHIIHLFLLRIILCDIIIFSGVANCNAKELQIYKGETIVADKYCFNRESLFLYSELDFRMAGEVIATEIRGKFWWDF